MSDFSVDSGDKSLISEDEWSDGEGLVAYGQVACNIERGEDESSLDFISRIKGDVSSRASSIPYEKISPKKSMI